MCKFRAHRTQTTNGNPQLSIVHRTGPARRVRDIEKGLFGIQRYKNIVVRRSSEVSDQIVVVRFERAKYLPAKRLGCLLALVVKREMLTLALRKFRFDVLFTLGLGEKLLHCWIWPEFKRVLPRSDRFLGMV